MSQPKRVCIAGCEPQEQRDLQLYFQAYAYEIVIFERQVPPPVKCHIIFIDCAHLNPSRIEILQDLISLNRTSALILIGQLTDHCELPLHQHTGKIFHLQKDVSFIEDLQETLDEINGAQPSVQWSLLRALRKKVFSFYGFRPLH